METARRIGVKLDGSRLHVETLDDSGPVGPVLTKDIMQEILKLLGCSPVEQADGSWKFTDDNVSENFIKEVIIGEKNYPVSIIRETIEIESQNQMFTWNNVIEKSLESVQNIKEEPMTTFCQNNLSVTSPDQQRSCEMLIDRDSIKKEPVTPDEQSFCSTLTTDMELSSVVNQSTNVSGVYNEELPDNLSDNPVGSSLTTGGYSTSQSTLMGSNSHGVVNPSTVLSTPVVTAVSSMVQNNTNKSNYVTVGGGEFSAMNNWNMMGGTGGVGMGSNNWTGVPAGSGGEIPMSSWQNCATVFNGGLINGTGPSWSGNPAGTGFWAGNSNVGWSNGQVGSGGSIIVNMGVGHGYGWSGHQGWTGPSHWTGNEAMSNGSGYTFGQSGREGWTVNQSVTEGMTMTTHWSGGHGGETSGVTPNMTNGWSANQGGAEGEMTMDMTNRWPTTTTTTTTSTEQLMERGGVTINMTTNGWADNRGGAEGGHPMDTTTGWTTGQSSEEGGVVTNMTNCWTDNQGGAEGGRPMTMTNCWMTEHSSAGGGVTTNMTNELTTHQTGGAEGGRSMDMTTSYTTGQVYENERVTTNMTHEWTESPPPPPPSPATQGSARASQHETSVTSSELLKLFHNFGEEIKKDLKNFLMDEIHQIEENMLTNIAERAADLLKKPVVDSLYTVYNSIFNQKMADLKTATETMGTIKCAVQDMLGNSITDDPVMSSTAVHLWDEEDEEDENRFNSKKSKYGKFVLSPYMTDRASPSELFRVPSPFRYESLLEDKNNEDRRIEEEEDKRKKEEKETDEAKEEEEDVEKDKEEEADEEEEEEEEEEDKEEEEADEEEEKEEEEDDDAEEEEDEKAAEEQKTEAYEEEEDQKEAEKEEKDEGDKKNREKGEKEKVNEKKEKEEKEKKANKEKEEEKERNNEDSQEDVEVETETETKIREKKTSKKEGKLHWMEKLIEQDDDDDDNDNNDNDDNALEKEK